MDSSYLLDDAPIWNINTDEGLENFIQDLKFTKKLGIINDEPKLIFLSLKNSGKTEIISSMSEAQKTKLENFISFLRTNY